MTEKTNLQSKIHSASAGHLLLDYVSQRFRYQTRDHWQEMIEEGYLTLNGKKANPETILRSGDLVSYQTVLNEPEVDKNIQIIHDEKSFLIADKPGWLPSHSDGNFIKNTFIYLIREKLKAQGWGGQAHLVHRLDRETSGLMVVAKSREAARSLARQFETGQVKKTYSAIVQGVVTHDFFEVDGSIGPDPQSQISVRRALQPEGEPGGQRAFTQFEVLRRMAGSTLVLCKPQTGRTGQIRVHLASQGHPLVHDKLYGRTDEEFLEFVRQSKAGWSDENGGRPPRHFLHAGRLELLHPLTGQALEFESNWPDDMRAFLEKEP
ncbi:MAG: RluA family pseudouridine synthase [bacterium]